VPNFVEIGQVAAEIWQFFDFSRWRPPPSWFFKILEGQDGQNMLLCQILRRLVKPLLRYGDFSIFQNGGRRRLAFLKLQIFNSRDAQEGQAA